MNGEQKPEEKQPMPEQTKKVNQYPEVLLYPDSYIYDTEDLDQVFTSYVTWGDEVIGRFSCGNIVYSLVDMS